LPNEPFPLGTLETEVRNTITTEVSNGIETILTGQNGIFNRDRLPDLTLGNGVNAVIETLNTETDSIVSESSTALTTIREGIDSFLSSNSLDFIIGGTGNEGDDILEGNEGDDILIGDLGDDVIRGGDGADFLLDIDGDDQLNAVTMMMSSLAVLAKINSMATRVMMSSPAITAKMSLMVVKGMTYSLLEMETINSMVMLEKIAYLRGMEMINFWEKPATIC
jgi:Ca2+-binding RTX toxin-like protein